MALGSHGYVSIAELVIYIPLLVLAVIVCVRHGFTRSSGWLYTVILCLLRVIGAVCQLLTYTDHSTRLLQTTLTIDSIGISPLLLATLGMLSRFVDFVNLRGASIFDIKVFRLLQLLCSVGLILGIVGGTSVNTSSDGTIKPDTTTKAAIILYIVAFAGMVYILIMSSSYKRVVPKQERRIPIAVAVACPFIIVRLVYSAVATFANNSTFSIIGGSVPVHVGMAVVEEFIVILDYVILGFSLRKLDVSEQGELASRPWKDQRRSRHRSGRSQGSELQPRR